MIASAWRVSGSTKATTSQSGRDPHPTSMNARPSVRYRYDIEGHSLRAYFDLPGHAKLEAEQAARWFNANWQRREAASLVQTTEGPSQMNSDLDEFKSYYSLADQLIDAMTTEQLAECLRVLALHVVDYRSRFGEIPRQDLLGLLGVREISDDQARLHRLVERQVAGASSCTSAAA